MRLPILLSFVVLGGALMSFSAHPAIPVKTIDLQYAADFSDDKVLMGASHNVFVGKVIKQSGTKERGIGPETQFEVVVVENIKGKLEGTVTVDQQGGYKDGALYVVEGDEAGKSKAEEYLLQPGSTYLLATRYNQKEDWYTLNPYPTASKLLTNRADLSDSQLKAQAQNDSRVKELQAVYPNEVLIDADIRNKNTLNSFSSSKAVINESPSVRLDTASTSETVSIPSERPLGQRETASSSESVSTSSESSAGQSGAATSGDTGSTPNEGFSI